MYQYTQSVPIRNGPIRHTSEIFGFFKKQLFSEILKVKKLTQTYWGPTD